MAQDPKKPFLPASLEPYERPLGRMVEDAGGEPYAPLRCLQEAQADRDGVVVLQGDDGGQIYVTCPASEVVCTSEVLEELLRDLDALAWPGNDPDMARVFYERRRVGSGVSGGMGGGVRAAGPWIHPDLVKLRLGDRIVEVLRGVRARVR
jgi:hypothetical protein